MPKVMIPPPYRGVTRGQAQVSVRGATVLECLDAVEADCPGFRELVFTGDGVLRRFTKIFRNGEPVQADALETSVGEGDEITVMSPLAGG
jgi:molybdopterin converting factor small subunit